MNEHLTLPAAYADWTPRHVAQVRAALAAALSEHDQAAHAVLVDADGGCGGATSAADLDAAARTRTHAAERVALCCARLLGHARAQEAAHDGR